MTLANDGNCFRCDEPGHWAAHCPLNERAATKAEHLARIDRIIQRWNDWENTGMTTSQKQRLIAAENELWKDNGKVKAK